MSAATERPLPRSRPDVVFRPLSREWVLYDPRTGQLHVLNVTAALVWKLCDGRTPPEAMVAEIRRTVEGAPESATVAGHVRDALARFREEGLLA